MDLLSVRMERCNGTPRQPGHHGQVGLLIQWHGPSALCNGGEDQWRHVQVDLLWLLTRPLDDLDLFATLLSRIQDQFGNSSPMAGDPTFTPWELAPAKKEASSPESVGEIWLRQGSETVIQRGFHGLQGAEAVRLSHGEFHVIVQAFDDARRNRPLGYEPVQD